MTCFPRKSATSSRLHQCGRGPFPGRPELDPGDIVLAPDGGVVPVTDVTYVAGRADRHNIVLGRNKPLPYPVVGVLVFNGW